LDIAWSIRVEVKIKSNLVQFEVKLGFYKFLTWQESQGEIPSHINIYQTCIQKLQIDTTIDFTYQTPHLQKLEEINIICKICYTWKSFLKPWKSLCMKGLRNHFIHNFFFSHLHHYPRRHKFSPKLIRQLGITSLKKLDILTHLDFTSFFFHFFPKKLPQFRGGDFWWFLWIISLLFSSQGTEKQLKLKRLRARERQERQTQAHAFQRSTVCSNFWKPTKNKFTPFDFTNLFKPIFIISISGDFRISY
jgi:hypothetical protein